MKKYKQSLDAGWTFIETLVVMAIVLILSVSVGFSAAKQLDKARIVSARSQIDTFCMALESYYLDNGFYPSKSQGLNALWAKPAANPSPRHWNGPYVSKKIPADPWGNEYVYSVPGPGGTPYIIKSFGKDCREGGEGNDRDITSQDE